MIFLGSVGIVGKRGNGKKGLGGRETRNGTEDAPSFRALIAADKPNGSIGVSVRVPSACSVHGAVI